MGLISEEQLAVGGNGNELDLQRNKAYEFVRVSRQNVKFLVFGLIRCRWRGWHGYP